MPSGDSSLQGWLLAEDGEGQRDSSLSDAHELLHREQDGGRGEKKGKMFPDCKISVKLLESPCSLPKLCSCNSDVCLLWTKVTRLGPSTFLYFRKFINNLSFLPPPLQNNPAV